MSSDSFTGMAAPSSSVDALLRWHGRGWRGFAAISAKLKSLRPLDPRVLVAFGSLVAESSIRWKDYQPSRLFSWITSLPVSLSSSLCRTRPFLPLPTLMFLPLLLFFSSIPFHTLLSNPFPTEHRWEDVKVRLFLEKDVFLYFQLTLLGMLKIGERIC